MIEFHLSKYPCLPFITTVQFVIKNIHKAVFSLSLCIGVAIS